MKEAMRRLEFHKITELLSTMAAFYGGKEKAEALMPANDLNDVQKMLQETTEAMELLRFNHPAFLYELTDVRPYLSKAKAGGVLYPPDLLEILRLVRAVRSARAFLAPGEGEGAAHLMNQLVLDHILEQEIGKAIDENGQVKDSASPELKSIRSKLGTLRSRIKDYLKEFIKSGSQQKYLQDAIVTERGGRYVVPVKQEFRHEVKGIVHDESASGATVFIEPEAVVASNNEIRKLELAEKREIEKILRRLTGMVAEQADNLLGCLEAMETLDFWIAKARLALSMDAHCPVLNDHGRIRLEWARHPLLDKDRVVPISLELGRKYRVLVITGPNTGGKTVTLKTVGLLTMMAMAGLYIPASPDSEIAVFSDILVDIGDEQSIEQSLSTFSAHMTNIIGILRTAGDNSLIILDELGAGTDPVEGAALARAIIEKLLLAGSRVLVSTHHSELKTMAYQHDAVENACVEFDPVSLSPTYRLTTGLPGQSNAIEIARRLGMDEELVNKARQFVPQQEMEISRMLKDLKDMRFLAQEEKEKAEALQKQLEQERNALSAYNLARQKEHEATLARLEEEARRYLSRVRQEAEDILLELKQRARAAEAPKWHELEELRRRYQEAVAPVVFKRDMPTPPVTRPVQPGDYVEISTIKQRGYVLEGPGPSGDIVVQVGVIKLSVKENEVKLLVSPEEQKSWQRNENYLEKRKNISTEINLRGKLAQEALAEMEQYVEDAYLAGLEKIRIIHGKGTGALRRAIREYLAGHPYIREFRDGDNNEGGHGVTIAYLKR